MRVILVCIREMTIEAAPEKELMEEDEKEQAKIRRRFGKIGVIKKNFFIEDIVTQFLSTCMQLLFYYKFLHFLKNKQGHLFFWGGGLFSNCMTLQFFH